MAVSKLTTPRVAPVSASQRSQLADLENAATNANRNIAEGPTDLMAIEVDNLIAGASKDWIKLYDDATTAWTPGTTKPIMVIPVETYAAAASRATGFLVAYCLEGYPFDEGISAIASKENGDTATAAPDGADGLNVDLIHRARAAIVSASAPEALFTGLRMMALGGSKETLRALIGRSDATPHEDITGTTGTIYRVRVNATQNPAEDVYVRFFDHATPTVGTTAAELLIPCKRGRDITWEIPRGIAFGTAISVATVQNKGATSGNMSPSGIVDVVIDMA